MQLKWLEDFTALAQARSFTRAAELRPGAAHGGR